jgi:hypothetical protein
MSRETNIQIRRGNASRWADVNPILDSGEMGYESDTGRFKIGDGDISWNLLDYAAPHNLSELLDVSIENVSNGQLLSYDASSGTWTNKTLQNGLIKTNSTQIGSYSNAGGNGCDSNGDYSLALGLNAITYGDYSISIGYNTKTNADYSFAFGNGAKTRINGQEASASGIFTNIGDAQFSRYHLRTETANNTSKELTIDGLSPNSNNRLIISPRSSWTFEIKLSAYNYTDNLGASFIFRGSIKRNNSNVTSLVGSINSDIFYEENMNSCSADVVADNTNDSLNINVVGINGKNILWHGVVDVSEVRKSLAVADDDYKYVSDV